MATTTTIPSPFPDDQPQQQQAEESVSVPGAGSTNAWQSSGSIGPFFAVISVLTVLAVISCIFGKICRGRRLSPLESIKRSGCCAFGFGWFRRKPCLGSVGGEVLGNKAVDGPKESNNDSTKAQDSGV